MPALYAPITAMLLGLIFRGVAFEFRWRTTRAKYLWDWAFAGGSMLAAFAQGIALGALIQGIPVSGRAYAGGWWDWLTWFSLLTGVALVVGYALLGSTWLIMKTTGSVQRHAYRFAWITGLATLALIGLVSLITPIMNPVAMARWFAWPAILYVAPVPIFVALAALVLLGGLYAQREVSPFFAAMALFVLSYIGLGISFYPYIVPPTITIWSAAAPGRQPRLPAGRRSRADPADPRLHRLVLLGVPRQGRHHRRLPLMPGEPSEPQRPLASRLLWFVLLWLAGVGAVAPAGPADPLGPAVAARRLHAAAEYAIDRPSRRPRSSAG